MAAIVLYRTFYIGLVMFQIAVFVIIALVAAAVVFFGGVGLLAYALPKSLAKFGAASKPSYTIPPSSLPGTWTIAYSPSMPSQMQNNGDGSYVFTFPSDNTGIHYVYTNMPAAVGQTITMKFFVSGTGEFTPSGGDTRPCRVQLFLQRNGDNLSAIGPYEFYRFWAGSSAIKLEMGEFTLSVPLTYDRWTGVYGKSDEAGFASCLSDLANIGFTFGGANFAGHGVYVTGGSARFTLKSFTVG